MACAFDRYSSVVPVRDGHPQDEFYTTTHAVLHLSTPPRYVLTTLAQDRCNHTPGMGTTLFHQRFHRDHSHLHGQQIRQEQDGTTTVEVIQQVIVGTDNVPIATQIITASTTMAGGAQSAPTEASTATDASAAAPSQSGSASRSNTGQTASAVLASNAAATTSLAVDHSQESDIAATATPLLRSAAHASMLRNSSSSTSCKSSCIILHWKVTDWFR